MKELKKCPICGENLTIENYNGKEINLKFRDMEKEDEYTAFCSCGFSFGLYDITLREFLDRLNTRKPMERIVERLEQQAEQYKRRSYEVVDKNTEAGIHNFGKACSYEHAIAIVKEEMS